MTVRKGCRGVLLGLAVLAADRLSAAEDAKAVVPGSRVRITTAQGRLVGRLVALQGETIVLERGKGGMRDIRRADVLGLEVSQGPGRKLRGAAIGLLVGLGAAVAVGVAGGEDCSTEADPSPGLPGFGASGPSLCFDHTDVGLMAGILAVPAGALLGAVIAPGEKWRPAGVAGLSVQAGASRAGGFGVQVAVAF
jgi:hypothetical protein